MVTSSDIARASCHIDKSSNSSPQVARCTHLDLEVSVDFEGKVVAGRASYDVEVIKAEGYVDFDAKDLQIRAVEVNGKSSDFELAEGPAGDVSVFGSRLRVSLPASVPTGSSVRVAIDYSTTPRSSAIQWLPPSQTLGGKRPYMFTQCQAIHARTLLPCQDAPAVKVTYKAAVTCKSWATVLMSALSRGKKEKGEDTVHDWEQPVPTSPYLIALCIGDLDSRDISPRCRVWSEPGLVDSVSYEFADTETFLTTAEDLTLKYQWTRYDLVCLPPSFPYGGMENPCLTFVTPTLLAGDRSLADVVAHEIAHSWTGNLVTNATWEHFWLNEGWTMWLQRKIMARVHKDSKFFDFDAIGGWEHLRDDVKLLPDEFTRLVPIIDGRDPDDAFSGVPYEKGFNLLLALERRVGSVAFEEFAKAYVKRFKFVTVTSAEFRTYFDAYFAGSESVRGFEWDTWFHEPGMPKETPTFDRTLSSASENLGNAWMEYDLGKAGEPKVDIKDWTTNQKTCFQDAMIASLEAGGRTLKKSTTAAMDAKYGFSKTKNCEVLFRFCKLAISAEDPAILPVALRLATTAGRMKYCRPLYRALYASKMGKSAAVKAFKENSDFYHAIAAKMIAQDLGLSQEKSEAPSTKGYNFAAIAAVATVIAVVAVVATRKKR